MKKKIDGIIEAVRYKNGQIVVVRAYERRGAAFSDYVLLDRKTLLERLQKGEQYASGLRKHLYANTFTVGKPILVVKENNHEFLATRENTTCDELEGVPVF